MQDKPTRTYSVVSLRRMAELASLRPSGPDQVVQIHDWPTLIFAKPRRRLAPVAYAVGAFAVVLAFLWALAQREPMEAAPVCLPAIEDCAQP